MRNFSNTIKQSKTNEARLNCTKRHLREANKSNQLHLASVYLSKQTLSSETKLHFSFFKTNILHSNKVNYENNWNKNCLLRTKIS